MARKRGNKWMADVRLPDGTRARPTFDTEAQADAWEANARLAVAEGRPLPPVATGKVGNRDLSTLGSLFEHTKRTHWASQKSASTLIRQGQFVVTFFGTNRPVTGIGSAEIAEFRASVMESGLSKATANRRCAALSKMLHIAHEAGAIQRVPRIPQAKEPPTKTRLVEDHEERAMLAFWEAHGDMDQHDLTALLLDTGARCFSEMIPAHWDHFARGFRSVTFWNTKTHKPRTVPLTKRSQSILKDRHSTFGETHAGPFTMVNKETMRTRWDKMRDFLRLRDVTPHTLRHTCISRLIDGGADVKRVMEWAGHSSITTTMRYMQLRAKSLEEMTSILERTSKRRLWRQADDEHTEEAA
jgi:integrase